jgi:cell wall-associated NlpC family hydrolase
MRFAGPRLRVAALSILAATVLVTMPPSPPIASAAEPHAAEVIAEARSHLGARYRWAAEGPRFFDCTGLVLRSFADSGLLGRVGGWKNRSASAMYQWFRRKGLTSRTEGRPGDVIIWGGGSHAGIYLGSGLAISALREGVRIHRVNAVTARFTAFARTNLSGSVPSKAVARAGRTTAVDNPRVRHTTAIVIVRAAAGMSAKALGKVARGAPLAIKTSRKDSRGRVWYSVRTAGGRTGWVAGWLTRN